MDRIDPVQHRSHAALWYAWGRIDQDPWGWRDVDAWAFRDGAVGEAEAYYNGETSHLASVQDQWRAYVRRIRGG
jgi:hypothetical protein